MEERKPFFSIVVPAYNAGEYIEEALRSAVSQSFADWELVLVDDRSTDDTFTIASRFAGADRRIRVERMPENSGCAFIPRSRAVRMSRGEYVVFLDADDYLAPDALEIQKRRIDETGADVVLGRMTLFNGERVIKTIPAPDMDVEMVCPGRDAVRCTLLKWKIGTGGGTFRRKLMLRSLDSFGDSHSHMNADELFTRQLLIDTPKLALSSAGYFYRELGSSVTHRIAPRYFDRLETNVMLKNLIAANFSEGSEERRLAEIHEYEQWLQYCIDYCRFGRTLGSGRKGVAHRLEVARRQLGDIALRTYGGRIKSVLVRGGLKSFLLFLRVWLMLARGR